jgi:hypothetical protein
MDALATRCSRCGTTMSQGLDERGEVVRYCPACADAHAQPLCPCCRRPLDRLDARQLAHLPFSRNATVAPLLLSILAHAWPRFVACETLVEYVYQARPNGEPETAAKSIQTTIVHLRQRLAPYGWTISDARASGYRLERVA